MSVTPYGTRPTSAALFERAQAVIPGGVNSPVRAFGRVGGTPRFLASARGAVRHRRRRHPSTSTSSAPGARPSSATRTPRSSRPCARQPAVA